MNITTITNTIGKLLIVLSILLWAHMAQGQTPEKIRQSLERAKVTPIKLDNGFWRPFGKATKISVSACFGGTTADLLATRYVLNNRPGFREGNPLFANPDGSLRTGRAMLVGYGYCGGTLLVEKRWPQLSKFLSVARFAASGLHTYAAIRNARLK